MSRYPHQNGKTSLAASGDVVATPQSDGRWKWEHGRSPSVASKVQVVIYLSGGHDSWSRTLTNAQMWNWLFMQNLGQQ